jgi:hypothetical protein
MNEPENQATATECSSHCYALIPYSQPSIFTALELAVLRHGNAGEWNRVLFDATVRMFGVPRHVIASDADCNYSSARMDYHG